jgi:signal transduction histidine kinase/CheY-like chemotaxis protein
VVSAAAWFSPRAPTQAEKRAFVILVVLYGAGALGVLRWATAPGLVNPHITAMAGIAILVADLCTALLLGAWYRATGRPALLVLTLGYFYGGIMAGLHLLTYPGALLTAPLFGNEQTVAWLYLAWRTGASSLYLVAVLVEAARAPIAVQNARNVRLVLGCALTAGACAALSFLAADPGAVEVIAAGNFTAINTAIIWGCVALCAAALVIIWIKGAFNDSLYFWLAVVLMAAIADLTLANAGGARYTLGWHLSRMSFVVSSCLLLAFAIGVLSPERQRRLFAIVAAYGGAIAAVLAAILVRWLLDPWLGNTVPFITLFGAVAVAVWLGGWAPAAFATVLGYVIVNFLYIDPVGMLSIDGIPELLQLVLFAGCSAMVIGLGEGMRRARDLYRASDVELRERAAALQRADANKSRFLAVLSHELRNPLAPLRNGLALLRLKPSDPATADKTLGMMERQITQLTRLIDDLLDVSRIDRGKLELRKERIALDAVARSAIETAMPGIEAKQHELVVRYAGQPLYVDGDPVRLAQVIANLLNNAAKFTPAGGRIELSMRADGGKAILSVADSGIGLAREHLREVFGMFVQLGGSRQTAAGGLGLGLTLVRSLIEYHGGQVEARSAGPDKGAEFIVTLPLAATSAAPAPRTEPQPAGTRRRILVVDDNEDAAQTLADLLRVDGHAVESARDGPGALRAAERLRPDVAFIDLNMPEMDGYELAKRLRATPWGRNATLVALTGMGQKADVIETRAAGFDEHLTKPADPARVALIAAGGDKDKIVPLRKTPAS